LAQERLRRSANSAIDDETGCGNQGSRRMTTVPGIPIWRSGSMFRPLLCATGTHRSIAVLIVMSMAATGVVITIVIDSIAFLVNVGTAASVMPVLPAVSPTAARPH
jgi:hypothetical protein